MHFFPPRATCLADVECESFTGSQKHRWEWYFWKALFTFLRRRCCLFGKCLLCPQNKNAKERDLEKNQNCHTKLNVFHEITWGFCVRELERSKKRRRVPESRMTLCSFISMETRSCWTPPSGQQRRQHSGVLTQVDVRRQETVDLQGCRRKCADFTRVAKTRTENPPIACRSHGVFLTYLLRWHVERHSSQVDLGVAFNARQHEENTCGTNAKQNHQTNFTQCCQFFLLVIFSWLADRNFLG